MNPHEKSMAQWRCELHELIVRGLLNSAKADEVRDELEAALKQLRALGTTHHLNAIQMLGSDLQSLESVRRNEITLPDGLQTFNFQLIRAAQNRDWRIFLEILRNRAAYLPDDRVACLRAWAWQNLLPAQDLTPAVLFLDGAARQILLSLFDQDMEEMGYS